VAEILDFYKEGVPRGEPFIKKETWTNGSTPELEVVPEKAAATPTTWEKFVDKIVFVASNNFALNGSDKIKITGLETEDIEVASLRELMSLCESVMTFKKAAADDTVVGVLKVRPAKRMRKTDNDSLKIENTGGATAVLTGEIFFSVQGWMLLESEY